jgi:hypothetical protein
MLGNGLSQIPNLTLNKLCGRHRLLNNNSASKGRFPLERFTATESSAVVIFTGNGQRGRLLNEQRQCPLPVKTVQLSAFRAAKRSSGNRP